MKKGNKKKFSDLRKKAEKELKSESIPIEKLSDEEVHKLAHELQVHQIELSMQNEELRNSQIELERSRDRYTLLYDYAPVGYFTISEEGLIMEVNLTGAAMLRIERSVLIQKPLSKFIAKTQQDKYYLFRRSVFKNEKSMVCDLKMVRNDHTQFHARIDCSLRHDKMSSSRQCMVIISDITKLMRSDNRTKTALTESLISKKNLQAIFKSIQDGIILLDSEQRIIEFNDSARRICGLPDINTARRKKFGTFEKRCKGECLEAFIESQNTKLPANRSRFECSSCLVSVTTNPIIDNNGQFTGCTIVVRDESRLAILEENLRERQQLHNIIGKSDALRKIFSFIETLSETSTTVLITGENGTGKGLVAEALHYHQKGSEKKPFVVISCSSLSESVLESELFGHIKGAFTGAVKR